MIIETLLGEKISRMRDEFEIVCLILDVPKDLRKVISSLSDRIIIYDNFISKHEKKLFRKENTKFELYRSKFYRDLSDKSETTLIC